MNAKRKLAMSAVAILVVLTLVAGATMAWFTDTEKVNANFTAGVLDITVGGDTDKDSGALEFINMRPMEKATFEEEANAVLNGEDFYAGKGYDPYIPVYAREISISNAGTLPAYLKFTFNDVKPSDEIRNVIPNGVNGVKQDGKAPCENDLAKNLDGEKEGKYNPYFHFALLEKDGANWNVVKYLSLADLKEDGYVLTDETTGEPILIPAQTTWEGTYAIGAYLDENAGNQYQGKHYHTEFVVQAAQTDEGATFNDNTEVK